MEADVIRTSGREARDKAWRTAEFGEDDTGAGKVCTIEPGERREGYRWASVWLRAGKMQVRDSMCVARRV
jgi:hypothetical protein